MVRRAVAAGPLVGVDVVDRTRARTARHLGNDRFINRVFSIRERERIGRAPDPEAEIWRLWAAKEAAYKVVSKLEDSPPVFEHARFEVTDPPGAPVRSLSWREVELCIGVSDDDHQVLAWAWLGPATPVLVGHESVDSLRSRLELAEDPDRWIARHFSREEAEAIHGLHSALVRVAARRDAARMLGVSEERLTIVCPPGHTGLRPPYLRDGGTLRADADISLSHDGAFLAWAIRLSS